MLIHPQIDPVALAIGPLKIHWYGMMYLLAFAQFIFLGRKRRQHPGYQHWSNQDVDDLASFGAVGVIIGGRLGEVLLYHPAWYFSHPWQIIEIWHGGMSFHGGLLGVLVATALFAHQRHRSFWHVTDFVAPLVPLGYALGRIGNFINAELVGRVVDNPSNIPWAMVFPNIDNLARHPSQIYHALLDGLLLFIFLWRLTRHKNNDGIISGWFAIGYGITRSITEIYRTPDFEIALNNTLSITSGQLYSLPLILIGAWLLHRGYSQQNMTKA